MSVKIYTTPECPYCKQAKAFFVANNIEFEEVDVSANDDAFKEMQEKSNSLSVPVIDVDGKIITGYDEAELKSIFNI